MINGNASMQQDCDECGKSATKIWRNYHGHRYCSTCYSREFKRSSCPQCGNFAKLPRQVLNAICRSCENNKPCVRCKKTEFSVAIKSEYGPVCGSCAPYFRKKKPCEICGLLTGQLSRVSRLRHDKKVCPKCARENHKSCQACSRHRLLTMSPDGALLCKVCLNRGKKECPSCQNTMPAGYGKRCENCYWKELFYQRCKLNQVVFDSENIRLAFNNYTQWLSNTCGHHKAAVVINKHLPFFQAIDKQWSDIPNFKELLAHFGAAFLRNNFLPFRWLTEEGYIEFDAQLKNDDREWNRIKKMITKFESQSKASNLIDSYYKALLRKASNNLTTPSSIRLALTPAIALLEFSESKHVSKLNQDIVVGYLSIKPGQRAALSGFIGHLRHKFNLPLELPPINNQISQVINKKKLKNKMLNLMANMSQTVAFRNSWVVTCLAYFHNIHKHESSHYIDSMVESNGGYVFHVDNQKLWIPLVDSHIRL